VGDPRFQSKHKNRREIIFEWTQKEFKNLERVGAVGVRVPQPIMKIKNILVMQYIGTQRQPAPMLKDVNLSNPEEIYHMLIEFVHLMYHQAQLVHGDLSAFNVLIHRKKPYLIDFAQGVLLGHPQSAEFLRRDLQNISEFFHSKYDIKYNITHLYKKIITSKNRPLVT
jgi:RIO kinase 1